MSIPGTVVAVALTLGAASAAIAQGVSTPSTASRPGTPMTAGQLPAEEEPVQPVAPGSTGRATPSTPSTPTAPGAAPGAPTTTPAMPGEARRPSALSMPVDPRGGSWEGVAPPTATLDSVLNSGVQTRGSKVPGKVCPPGLLNNGGNCVAPAAGIMR